MLACKYPPGRRVGNGRREHELLLAGDRPGVPDGELMPEWEDDYWNGKGKARRIALDGPSDD